VWKESGATCDGGAGGGLCPARGPDAPSRATRPYRSAAAALPAARLEQLFRCERGGREPALPIAGPLRAARENLRIAEVRRRLDDRLGARRRIVRLEDARA